MPIVKSPLAISAVSLLCGATASFIVVLFAVGLKGDGFREACITCSWMGLFIFVGWIVFVAPISRILTQTRVFYLARTAWLAWAIYAIAVYFILLSPIFGGDAFRVVYVPAIVGAASGIVFSILRKRSASL